MAEQEVWRLKAIKAVYESVVFVAVVIALVIIIMREGDEEEGWD